MKTQHLHHQHSSTKQGRAKHARSHRSAQGEILHLDTGDLRSLIRALEVEQLHAAPWQISSLKHTLGVLIKLNDSRTNRGRS